jgi:hypothetical protein
MTSTADILITDGATGAPIISDLSFGTGEYYRPTQVIATSAGAAVTADASNVDVNRDIYVGGELKIAIANATTTDTGRVSLIIEEAA